MAEQGFGSELWKNVQAVRLTSDGSLQAPVSVSGSEGIVVGVDALAEAEGAPAQEAAPRRRWWRRRG